MIAIKSRKINASSRSMTSDNKAEDGTVFLKGTLFRVVATVANGHAVTTEAEINGHYFVFVSRK